MRRLSIRNVGPIKDVNIDLNKVNVFIGPQSSGKSTIAKIFSTCSWVEKEVVTMQDEHVVADAASFKSLMEEYHKMTSYFDEDSEVVLETDYVLISLKGIEFGIKLKNHQSYQREKICYIPSERNSVTLPELQGFEFGQTNMRSFLFDWYNAREFYKEDNKTEILDLGVKYFYDPRELKYKDRIEHVNGKTYQIPLGSASSGLQSVVPLQVMMQYYSGLYFDTFDAKTSFDQEEKYRMIRSHLTDSVVLKRMFGKLYNQQERSRYVKEANDRLHNGDTEAVKLMEEYRAEVARLTVPVRTSYIVEEKEQNLFPKTQMELLYRMISSVNDERGHRLMMTTHSPYVLFALNNCLLAYLVRDGLDESVASEVKSVKYALNPADVSVWSVKDGRVLNDRGETDKTIQDERGLVRKNYFNDVMKDVMNDFNTLLAYME